MNNALELITEVSAQVEPYDFTAADTLQCIVGLVNSGMHPLSAMRRVRAAADTACNPHAKHLLHQLADDLCRVSAGPEEIDLHATAIRAAFGGGQ